MNHPSVAIKETVVAGHKVGHALVPGRPLIVLCRMASRESGVWDGLWKCLSDRFSLAAFDLPSPDDRLLKDPVSLFRSHAELAQTIVQALGHRTYTMLGWNGGTHVALRAAVEHPEMLDRIVLLGAFARLADMRQIDAGLRVMQALMRLGDRELYAYFWFMGGFSEAFVRDNFDEVERMARARAERDRFLTVNIERMTRWAAILRQDWVSPEELARISTRCLILAPTENRWNAGPTLEMGELLASRISSSTLMAMHGLGPLAPIEAPDLIADRVRTFCEEGEGY